MNKAFDDDRGGRIHWIAWLAEIMHEALRVIKPGGHALVWSLPRTSHWTGMALEDAGWEVRDIITHLFGSGFPKSHNISAAIDKELGVEREVQWLTSGHRNRPQTEKWVKSAQEKCHVGVPLQENGGQLLAVTFPATPEAAQWQGFGSALKPACEFWWLCRKPLSEKNIAQNVLRWNGCGSLNIDQCRVSSQGDILGRNNKPGENGWKNSSGGPSRAMSDPVAASGRFPSNLVMSHDPRCIARGTKRVRANGPMGHKGRTTINDYGIYEKRSEVTHADEHGQEEVQAFECVEGCPVRVLGEQAGESKSSGGGGYHEAGQAARNGIYGKYGARDLPANVGLGDEGSKARYFQQFHDPLSSLEAPFHYFSKSSRRDRNSGLEGMPTSASSRYGKMNGTSEHGPKYDTPEQNTHPCVKSTALMRWLVRLCTPPGGIVLDPFAGSGSTCCAAVYEGMHFIGIEQSNTPDAPYVDIARARIAHAQQEARREESEGQEYMCVEECPIRVLGEQSGMSVSKASPRGGTSPNPMSWGETRKDGDKMAGHSDKGTAARYFTQLPPDPVSLWDLLEECGS